MRFIQVLLFLVCGCMVSAATANQTEVAVNSWPPAALADWKSMLGNWSTTEESLQQDGSGWHKTANADWHFYLAMDGWAIRDEYFSPPLSEDLRDPSKRQIGTNIRVYNQEKKQWLMAWMTKSANSIDAYSAQSDQEQIVMLSKQKNSQGYFSRITFFDMQQDSFEWKMEWSTDGLSNWLEVHRIHGTRKKQ